MRAPQVQMPALPSTTARMSLDKLSTQELHTYAQPNKPHNHCSPSLLVPIDVEDSRSCGTHETPNHWCCLPQTTATGCKHLHSMKSAPGGSRAHR